MKFLKYIISIIIAISIIPIIIISVNKITSPPDKTINFKVVYDVEDTIYRLDPNVYNDLVLLMEIDDDIVNNLVSIKVDDYDILNFVEDFCIKYNDSTGDIRLMRSDDSEHYDTIKNNNTVIFAELGEGILYDYADNGNNISVSMAFKISNKIPPLVLVMLGLIPTVFISGILYFIFKKQNE